MQLNTLRCPACGATLNVDLSQTQFKCEYCKNTINIIKPITSSGLVEGLSEIEQNKYNNYLSILEQSMLAGNYTEGYNYCNKGLEINPKSAELWANKAICSLWISTVAQLSEEKAMEIITYLNACKQNDPDLKIYTDTAQSIADNLYYCTLYKYNTVQPDKLMSSGAWTYSIENERELLSCVKVLELCNEIHPDIKYLIQTLRLLNSGKLPWLTYLGGNSANAIRQSFDAAKKREKLVEKIKQYHTPEKMEGYAKSDYTEFCTFACEFRTVDRKFYDEYFLPLVIKYKPPKPPLTPEQLRKKKRNKIIAFSILISIILIPIIILVFPLIFSNKNTDDKTKVSTNKVIEMNDSMKNVKVEYDKKYSVSEFNKEPRDGVFAQRILVFSVKDITDKKEKEIADFYRDYYREWASVKYNKRVRLQMWFYTESVPAYFNPDNASKTEEARYQKYFYGNLFYNYDSETYKGTIK